MWLDNKKAGNIQGKILFLGDIKGTDELIPVLDIKFDNYGVKYGFAGNQAVLFADTKQNYELPESILHEIGVETIQIPRTRVERAEVSRTHINGVKVENAEYETIDITILRRGVIGVNKIANVLNTG